MKKVVIRKATNGSVTRVQTPAPKANSQEGIEVVAAHGKDSKNYLRFDIEEGNGITGSLYVKEAMDGLAIPLVTEPVKGLHAIYLRDTAKGKKRYDLSGGDAVGNIYVDADMEPPVSIVVTFKE